MIVNCFSDKICPRIHDIAMKKEGFGNWKEDYVSNAFRRQEDDYRELLRAEAQARVEAQEAAREEANRSALLAAHHDGRKAGVLRYAKGKVLEKSVGKKCVAPVADLRV